MYMEAFMTRAIELSAHSLDKPGTRPFGAVVVKDGKVVGEGWRVVTMEKDIRRMLLFFKREAYVVIMSRES